MDETREYLLEKWGRKCAYPRLEACRDKRTTRLASSSVACLCNAENVPLQVEQREASRTSIASLHGDAGRRQALSASPVARCACFCASELASGVDIVPRARGGTNRVSNLTLACERCNRAKGARPVEEFLKNKPELLAHIKSRALAPLSSAAAVNSTRNALLRELRASGLPVETGSGGLTKYNRTRMGLPKTHVHDALCVGHTESSVVSVREILRIDCCGRGQYSRTHADKYGFPRAHLPRTKVFFGFATGDIVRADVCKGKYEGVWTGRVSVRESGWFSLATGRTMDGKKERINVKHDTCEKIQNGDGYEYTYAEIA